MTSMNSISTSTRMMLVPSIVDEKHIEKSVDIGNLHNKPSLAIVNSEPLERQRLLGVFQAIEKCCSTKERANKSQQDRSDKDIRNKRGFDLENYFYTMDLQSIPNRFASA